MTPVTDPFMADAKPTGLQRGRGGFLRSADDVIECPECDGTGLLYADPKVFGRYGSIMTRCIYCAGGGYWLGAI